MSITDLCQESPPSLLPEHNKNWPSTPRAAPSKILPQDIFPPAPAQSKHLLSIELVGILGLHCSCPFQVSGNKTRQCTETQGKGLLKPTRQQGSNKPPRRRGEKSVTNCLTLLGEMKTIRPRWAATSRAHFSTGVNIPSAASREGIWQDKPTYKTFSYSIRVIRVQKGVFQEHFRTNSIRSCRSFFISASKKGCASFFSNKH